MGEISGLPGQHECLAGVPLHQYTVLWEIDVTARDEKEAAREAYARLLGSQPFDMVTVRPRTGQAAHTENEGEGEQ